MGSAVAQNRVSADTKIPAPRVAAHRLANIALTPPAVESPIQAVFTLGGTHYGKGQSKDSRHGKSSKAFDTLWKSIPADQKKAGDRKILEGLAEADEDLNLPAGANHTHLVAEIAKKRAPAAGKRKRGDKPEGFQERRADASVGTHVDYRKDRGFRTERRIRRRAPGVAGRNVYVTNYEQKAEDAGAAGLPAKRRRFKLATVSHPPGGLPKDESSLSAETLAAVTKIGHSEATTERTEEHWPEMKGAVRTRERTTREQCKDCRVHYPSKGGADHGYGFLYSAPVDHIKDDALRAKVLANGGKIEGLKLTAGEKADFAKASASATWARQFAPDQNPALEKTIGDLGTSDSDDDYSSDEDTVYADPVLRRLLPDTKKLGKAPFRDIPPKFMMSAADMQEQKDWAEQQRKKATEAATKDDDSSMSDDDDDDG